MGIALSVKPSFKDRLRKLTDEEYETLKENIIEEGKVREAIIYWEHEGKNWIVDGVNRFDIATKAGIPYKTTKKHFNSEGEALCWIAKNQYGRRNSTPEEHRYLRGMWYVELRDMPKPAGVSINAAEIVAEETGVDERSIRRDAEYAEALDQLSKPVRDGILTGDITASKEVVEKLLQYDADSQQRFARDVRVKNSPNMKERLRQEGEKFKSDKPEEKPANKKNGAWSVKDTEKAEKASKAKPDEPPKSKEKKKKPTEQHLECPCCNGVGWIVQNVGLPPKLGNSKRFQKAWALYESERKSRKIKPLGTHGKTQLFKRLIEWGPEKAARALELSVKNGWQGVFDPDDRDNKNGTGKHSNPVRDGMEFREPAPAGS